MRVIFSGFDTIVFAVKGALSPEAIKRMEHVKERAEGQSAPEPYPIKGSNGSALLRPTGLTGGYAFVICTGPIGQQISLKKNLSRTEWNGHVKIRSLCLATLGWEAALEDALSTLKQLEFHVSGISMNRVDYCMDFLNTAVSLDPRDFIAHARVKKKTHCVPLSEGIARVSTCKEGRNSGIQVTANMRSDVFESITIGKMPGRQVIVYDKRREAIDKRTFSWFKIWGVDRFDLTQHVTRIELRAGKNELAKYKIRSFEDFRDRIGDLFIKATESIRMVEPHSNDSNVSRRALHPTWKHVQQHVKERLFEYVSNYTPEQIIEVIAEDKAREYMASIRGNLAGYAVCRGIAFENATEELTVLVREELQLGTKSSDMQFSKAYVKAQGRLSFLDPREKNKT